MRPWTAIALVLLTLAITPMPAEGSTPVPAAAPVPCSALPSLPGLLSTPSSTCEGIRPGARLSNGCTMSWVLSDLAGNLYITTAGHCAGLGSRMGSATAGEFGTVVVQEAITVGNDFAVIQIDPAMRAQVNPTLCHFSGPIAMAPPGASGGVYEIYGWGYMTSGSEDTRARSGIEVAPPAALLAWDGLVSGGDSGSPVMSVTGLAMGIATHAVNTGPLGAPLVSINANAGIGTTLSHILAISASQGYVLTLVPGEPVSGVV
jgi:hypothetical protein